MQVLIVKGPGIIEYKDTEKPIPTSGEVRLKVVRLGLCGSDLSTWRGTNPMVTYPMIIGHEISGIIDEIGPGVPANLTPGLKATIIPYTHCGSCSSCLQGRTNACKNNETMGVQRDGASREFIVVPWEKILLAEDLTLDELVMVEPLSVGFHAVSRGNVSEKDYVAVFGTGMVGLGAIIASADRTEAVIAIDIADEKLCLAHEIGAKFSINSMTMDLHNKLNVITNGHGPGVMIEAVGLPKTFRDAVEEVAFAGRVVYVGYAKAKVEYESRYFVMKELDIRGSRNAVKEDFEAVIETIRKKSIDINKLITRKIPFTEIGQALNDWSDDPTHVTKLVIDMES